MRRDMGPQRWNPGHLFVSNASFIREYRPGIFFWPSTWRHGKAELEFFSFFHGRAPCFKIYVRASKGKNERGALAQKKGGKGLRGASPPPSPLQSSVTRRAVGLATLIRFARYNVPFFGMFFESHRVIMRYVLRFFWGNIPALTGLNKSAPRPPARVMAKSGCNNIQSEPSFPKANCPTPPPGWNLRLSFSPLFATAGLGRGECQFFPGGDLQFWKRAGGISPWIHTACLFSKFL